MQNLTGMDAVRNTMPLARLARELNLTRGAVAQWKQVPAERLREVAIATNLPIQTLRPDLFENTPQVAS